MHLSYLLLVSTFCFNLASSAVAAGSPRLILTEQDTTSPMSRVVSYHGNGTSIYRSLNATSYLRPENLMVSFGPRYLGLAFDYDDRLIFWSDPGRKVIKKAKMDQITPDPVFNEYFASSAIFGGTSSTVVSLAVDWLSNKVYWADPSYNWIMICDYDGSHFAQVVTTGLDQPRGICLNPIAGYLFWTDWGSNPKIERSTLSGKNRITLLSGNIDGSAYIQKPSNLVIDYGDSRLYWVEGLTRRLMSMAYDGQDIIVHASLPISFSHRSNAHILNLAIDESHVFVANWRRRHIDVIPRDSYQGEEKIILDRYQPVDMILYDHKQQPVPSTPSPCRDQNGGCSHMCVSDRNNRHQCMCSTGHKLESDGRTCRNETSVLQQPQLLFTTENRICQIPANLADAHLGRSSFNFPCVFNFTATLFDFDLYQEKIYVYDPFQGLIKRFSTSIPDSLDSSQSILAVEKIRGLAVDWLASNLYWASATQLFVSKLDGSYKRKIIEDRAMNLTALTLHPQKGLLYWVNNIGHPVIERATMSGRRREVIVYGLRNPAESLTIDHLRDRLYYIENSYSKIKSVGLSGEEGKDIFVSSISRPFTSLTVFQDYLFINVPSLNRIIISNLENGGVVRMVTLDVTPHTLKFFSDSQQPIVPGPCDVNNCDQMCLPTNAGAECVCADDSSTTCTAVVRCPLAFTHGRIQNGNDRVCDNRPQKKCSYTCDEGFLKKDPTLTELTCREDGSWSQDTNNLCGLGLSTESFLLVTDSVEKAVFYLDLTDPTLRPTKLPLSHSLSPVAVDFDFVDKMIYWSDISLHTINKATLDGINQVIAHANVSAPDGLAVDAQSGNIYWTDGELKRIETIETNGFGRRTLVGHDLDKPRAIAIDNKKGYIYWTDWGMKPRIERIRLDGSGREILVNTTLKWPNGLAVDDERIYWCDGYTNTVESAKTDGSDRSIVLQLPRSSHAFGLALQDGDLYWTDWQARQVLHYNTKSGSNTSSPLNVQSVFKKPNDVHYYRYVPSPSTPQAKVTKHTTSENPENSVSPNIDQSKSEEKAGKSGANAVALGVSLTFVCLVALFFALLLVIKLQRRRRDNMDREKLMAQNEDSKNAEVLPSPLPNGASHAGGNKGRYTKLKYSKEEENINF